MMIEKFKVINSLEGITFLRVTLERIALSWALPNKLLLELNLILEELCSNYMEHAGEDPKSFLEIQIASSGDHLEITVMDDGKPFNPNSIDDPDVDLAIERRKPGGLGLYFVKHYSDSMQYVREGEKNVITIIKSLKAE